VADKEKKMGQQFEIDVEVSLDCNQAISKDDISKTVDYSLIYDFVVSKFSSKKYNLIEALAGDIAQSLTQEFTLENCKVIIRKPDAPINGILDTVEAEVTYHA
jgi:dihydroneopterin aldolase